MNAFQAVKARVRAVIRASVLSAGTAIAATAILTAPVQAASISGLDLYAFDFEIVNVSSAPGVTTGPITGTSNGIGWTIEGAGNYGRRTVTDNSAEFNDLPVKTDRLHLSGDYTITFDVPIHSLLVALGNDNLPDSIDFSRVPSDSTDITVGTGNSSTELAIADISGALALFGSINSTTIKNTNQHTDGYDIAFWANPVPLPAAAWLFGSVLVGAAVIGRRRKTW